MIKVVVTAGDPAGIGPELCLALADRIFDGVHLVVCADMHMLQQRADDMGLAVRLVPKRVQSSAVGELQVVPLTDTRAAAKTSVAGVLSVDNAAYVVNTISQATQGCLSGQYDAMITGPVHKGIINDAGIAFTGHTEFIADLCDRSKPVMMLANTQLRVTLVTTHLPLKEVPQAVTADNVEQTIRIVAKDLTRHYGLKSPKIQVCGLNPHAGEGGHLGYEEIEIIGPVIEALKSEGYQLQGPVPADTAFTPSRLQDCDAVVAMYHDQGLSVIKSQSFGEIVNVTLGLPIIRTSVDHGTALDIAGQGKASISSFIAAIEHAADIVRAKNGS